MPNRHRIHPSTSRRKKASKKRKKQGQRGSTKEEPPVPPDIPQVAKWDKMIYSGLGKAARMQCLSKIIDENRGWNAMIETGKQMKSVGSTTGMMALLIGFEEWDEAVTAAPTTFQPVKQFYKDYYIDLAANPKKLKASERNKIKGLWPMDDDKKFKMAKEIVAGRLTRSLLELCDRARLEAIAQSPSALDSMALIPSPASSGACKVMVNHVNNAACSRASVRAIILQADHYIGTGMDQVPEKPYKMFLHSHNYGLSMYAGDDKHDSPPKMKQLYDHCVRLAAKDSIVHSFFLMMQLNLLQGVTALKESGLHNVGSKVESVLISKPQKFGKKHPTHLPNDFE